MLAPRTFKSALGIFDVTMIVIGAVIGGGIFLTPSSVVRALGDPSLVMALWVAGGLMAIAGGLTFAELAHLQPNTGGIYAYLSTAYSPAAGFMYGWCMLTVMNAGSMAALCVACVSYLSYFIPLSPWAMKLLAIGIVVYLTITNYFGVRQGSIISNIFTMTKIAGIAALILGAMILPHAIPASAPPLHTPSNLVAALALGMVGVLWSYGGWQYATFPAGETKNPARNIPLGMFFGVAAIVAIYISVNIAYLSVLTPAVMARESRVASLTAEYLVGPAGASIVSALIALSTFGTASVFTLGAPRITYAMARDGLFFERAGRLHPRYGTPSAALLIQCAIVIVYILSGTFDQLVSYVAFVDWIFYALAAGALFRFRKKFRGKASAYRTPGYPVTPAFFILVAAWFVIYLYYNEPVKSSLGLGVFITGIPVYLYWKSVRGKGEEKKVEREG